MEPGLFVQICSDGATDESRGIIGAAAVMKSPHGNITAECCYAGHFEGPEVSEHVGLLCAISLVEAHVDPPRGVMFNLDNKNASDRYTDETPSVIIEEFGHLVPLVALAQAQMKRLEARGYVCEVSWFPREFNTVADALAGSQLNLGRTGQFLGLSTEVEDKLLQSGRLLRQRGALSKSRARRQRLQVRQQQGSQTSPPLCHRYSPQPPGVAVCGHQCSLCEVHTCGFKLHHVSRHECWDCHMLAGPDFTD